jgi:DNA-binding transcriptional regulator YiaG
MRRTCERCGRWLRLVHRTYHYRESGLPDVFLRKIPMYVCPHHGVQTVVLRGIDRLQGDIRSALLDRGGPFSGPEVRFLRKYEGWTQSELAARLGVHKITVTRWETESEPVGAASQQLLYRLFKNPKAFEASRPPAMSPKRATAPIVVPRPRSRAKEPRAAV